MRKFGLQSAVVPSPPAMPRVLPDSSVRIGPPAQQNPAQHVEVDDSMELSPTSPAGVPSPTSPADAEPLAVVHELPVPHDMQAPASSGSDSSSSSAGSSSSGSSSSSNSEASDSDAENEAAAPPAVHQQGLQEEMPTDDIDAVTRAAAGGDQRTVYMWTWSHSSRPGRLTPEAFTRQQCAKKFEDAYTGMLVAARAVVGFIVVLLCFVACSMRGRHRQVDSTVVLLL